MIITINNVCDITEKKQQEVGQALLITLAHHLPEMNDVRVEFDEEF